jgi:hypothetical protein
MMMTAVTMAKPCGDDGGYRNGGDGGEVSFDVR